MKISLGFEGPTVEKELTSTTFLQFIHNAHGLLHLMKDKKQKIQNYVKSLKFP